MSKRLALRALCAIVALAASTFAALAEPNQPVAPFEGACGYIAEVASPPYYWGTNPPTSLSQCKNVDLPALVAWVQAQGYTIQSASCRPSRWCPK